MDLYFRMFTAFLVCGTDSYLHSCAHLSDNGCELSMQVHVIHLLFIWLRLQTRAALSCPTTMLLACIECSCNVAMTCHREELYQLIYCHHRHQHCYKPMRKKKGAHWNTHGAMCCSDAHPCSARHFFDRYVVSSMKCMQSLEQRCSFQNNDARLQRRPLIAAKTDSKRVQQKHAVIPMQAVNRAHHRM